MLKITTQKSQHGRDSYWGSGILQSAQQHGGAIQLFVAVKDWSRRQPGGRPSHGDIDSEQRKRCISAQQQSIVHQSPRGVRGLGIPCMQDTLSHQDEDCGISPCDLNVRRHGEQALPSDQSKFGSRQAPAQILVFRGINQIAEGFDVNRLNLTGESCFLGNLQAAGERNPQRKNQGQRGGDNENDSQSHGCTRRSSSRFQTSRLFSGSGIATLTIAFCGTSR